MTHDELDLLIKKEKLKQERQRTMQMGGELLDPTGHARDRELAATRRTLASIRNLMAAEINSGKADKLVKVLKRLEDENDSF